MCCLAVFQVFWCILGMASGTVKRVYESSRDRTCPLDMWFSLAEALWRRSRTSSLKDTLITHLHQTTHLTTDDLTMRCVHWTPACLFAAVSLSFTTVIKLCYSCQDKPNCSTQSENTKTLFWVESTFFSAILITTDHNWSLFLFFHLSLLCNIQCTFTMLRHYIGLYLN